MGIIDAIILGIIQGATEFIPVSSTGHLILAREFLNLQTETALAFDAVLQLASIFAVMIVSRADIFKIVKTAKNLFVAPRLVLPSDKKFILALVVGSIPAIVLGLSLESYMETTFRGAVPVIIGLLIGSIIMFLAERFFFKRPAQHVEVGAGRGFFIGIYQALALFPGISRSGATISGGLFAGLDRAEATRFSFLLAIPIILGSGILKLFELITTGSLNDLLFPLIVGSLFSFVVGYAAVSFLLSFVKTHSLMPFVYYRLVLAIIIVIVLV